MRYILTFMMLLGLSPLLTSAATYSYVDTQGQTRTVEAGSANEAIANAPNRAPNSGVAIDMGYIEPGTTVPSVAGSGPETTYHYVTSAGMTASVEAANPTAALNTAPNIAYNSGVAIDRGYIESGTAVPGAMNQ